MEPGDTERGSQAEARGGTRGCRGGLGGLVQCALVEADLLVQPLLGQKRKPSPGGDGCIRMERKNLLQGITVEKGIFLEPARLTPVVGWERGLPARGSRGDWVALGPRGQA